MPLDKKKYKEEFKRQKAKGKKFGAADKAAMKHAALPYKTKSKTSLKPKKIYHHEKNLGEKY